MSAKLNIGHDFSDLTPDDAIITYLDYEDGYRYSVQDVSLKPADYKKFISDVEAGFGKLTEYDYSKNKNQVFKKMQNSRMRGYFRGNAVDMFGSIYTTTEDDAHFIWKTYIAHSHQENNIEIFVHSMFVNNGQLEENTKLIKAEDLNYISDKYYPYINTQVMFDQFFTGTENILLVVGEPGLGKCLGKDEEIEIFVDDDTYNLLSTQE